VQIARRGGDGGMSHEPLDGVDAHAPNHEARGVCVG
jgi:hypothetical protein